MNEKIEIKKENCIKLDKSNISQISGYFKPNTTILCFTDHPDSQLYNEFIKSHKIKNFYYFGNIIDVPEEIHCRRMTKSFFQKMEDNIVLVFFLNSDFKTLRESICVTKAMITYSQKWKKNMTFHYQGKQILGLLYGESKYTQDLIQCLNLLQIDTAKEQQNKAYDLCCDQLDQLFMKNNYCEFHHDNTCIANRKRCLPHSEMGCCYSFKYTGNLTTKMVKNVQLCKHQQNKTCNTKNLGCKLFTCRYLKEKGILFDSSQLLLLQCFFSKKEIKILTSNFFKSKEELFQKIRKKDHSPYWWFIAWNQYRI